MIISRISPTGFKPLEEVARANKIVFHFHPVAYEPSWFAAFRGLEMKKNRKRSVVEMMQYDGFLTKELDALQSTFKEWNSTEGRGNHQLWDMLGSVYELAAKVDANGAAIEDLISQVEAVDGVAENNHWDPEKKTPEELLLTLLLGLKPETKATKSQWLGAIKAARKAKIKPAKDDCSAWFKSVGGIQAARKTLRKEPVKKNFKEWVEAVGGYDDVIEGEDTLISIPAPLVDEQFPEKMAVVLVRQIEGSDQVKPIGTVTNQSLIQQAIKCFLASENRIQREIARSMKQEQTKKDAYLLRQYKAYAKKYPGEYYGYDDWLAGGAEMLKPAEVELIEMKAITNKLKMQHKRR